MGKRGHKIFTRLADLMNNDKSRLHILEETIPVSEQFEYFNYSNKVRDDEDQNVNRNYLVSLLFTPELDIEEKRRCLSILAGLSDVGAYRAIETYHSSPLEPELANWSALALIESRILLNSDLTGEQQVFISTGLGGHNNKLRYFFVVANKDLEPFSPLQHEIIEREFKFQFNLAKIEIEEIEYEGYYIIYIVLADIAIDIKEMVMNVVKECNEYGNFIRPEVLITNTKFLTKDEIEHNLRKKGTTTPDSQPSIEI